MIYVNISLISNVLPLSTWEGGPGGEASFPYSSVLMLLSGLAVAARTD